MTARPNHCGRALQDVEGGNAPGHDTPGSSSHTAIIRRLRIPSATIEAKKTIRVPQAVWSEPASCGSMVPPTKMHSSPLRIILWKPFAVSPTNYLLVGSYGFDCAPWASKA